MTKASRGGEGLAVDASGGIAFDPSANVIALNEAAVQRLDDLRGANERLLQSEIRALRAENQHLKETAGLRAEHSKEIREIESNRLNAIRQVDVLAGNTAADRALVAIQTLAITTESNANNLRNALTSTATTIAAQTANSQGAIIERIAALEKSSYEGSGKSKVADPLMAELISKMNGLVESRAGSVGRNEGLSVGAQVLMGAAGFIATMFAIGGAIYGLLKP